MTDELVPHTSKVEIYSSTCDRCYWRGDKNALTDYVSIPSTRSRRMNGRRTIEIGKYPDRCYKCDAQRKRLSRMRKALEELDWYNKSLARPAGVPKMVTIGLPSVPDDPRTLEEQIQELKVKWKIFRNYLLERMPATWIGGISNVEVTTRINFDLEKGPWFGVKHHAHIHSAVLLRWMPKEALIEFCSLPLKFGLGRANITSYQRGQSYKDYKWHLSNYMAKYITKGNIRQRSIRFGIMDKRWRDSNLNPKEEEPGSL